MRHKKWFLSVIILTVIIVILGCFIAYLDKGHALSLKKTNISIGQNVLSAEIADTEGERELGLGNRRSLPKNQAMLFVFDHPDTYGFWMKDTLIPLDMIWIDQNKTIIYIKSDVLPSTYPTVFYPEGPALYVLETNAGYAESHQIKIGSILNF